MITPALQQQIRSQAAKIAGREMRSGDVAPQRLKEIASAVTQGLAAEGLNLNLDVVEKQLQQDFAAFCSGAATDKTPVAQKTGGHKSVQGLMLDMVARHSTKKWDPIGKMPPELAARLSDGDRSMIQGAVDELQAAVQKKGLDHVPVFGYLSLRTDNHRELGKASQSDVVDGKDVVPANLKGWDLEMVASTVYRGTPEHPGAVAGLGKSESGETPGVILKVPLSRAEELLAVVLAREFFAEGDLKDSDGPNGPVSNAMYKPLVAPVSAEGDNDVPALVFVTNEDGAKSMPNIFQKKDLSEAEMAWLFSAQGGFVDGNGDAKGGPSVDYWEASYVKARDAAGQPVNPKIREAVDRAKLMPQREKLDEILQRSDPDGRLMQEALLVLFEGATVSLDIMRQQQDGGGIERKPNNVRPFDEGDLLAKAKELAAEGKIGTAPPGADPPS